MKITVDWLEGKYPSFNLNLASSEGREPFLTVKGCRVVDGSKGQFVSWPAKKLESGKYFNYCWASEGFNAAVLEVALAAMPVKSAGKSRDDDLSDVPF